LAALLGPDAPNLSPGAVTRLTAGWQADHERWQSRDLSARRYVYVRAGGVCLRARGRVQAGADRGDAGREDGTCRLPGRGAGERARRWHELPADLKSRGLAIAPEIAVGDGAPGVWKAVDEAWPHTRHQRCWVHKTSNVLNKLPKSVHPAAKADLREIRQAETRVDAPASMPKPP